MPLQISQTKDLINMNILKRLFINPLSFDDENVDVSFKKIN